MINDYYDQFRDDDDLYPIYDRDLDDDEGDCEPDEDEEQPDIAWLNYPCCGGSGCNNCLCVGY